MPTINLEQKKAFTLVELLVVISIIALMASLSGPALQAISGSGSTNKAASDLAATLELARSYAMANNTYVRVGFNQAGPSFSQATLETVVVSVYSQDGSESSAFTTANWPFLSKPLFLNNFATNSTLNGTSPNTSSDVSPFSSSSSFGSLNLTITNLGSVSFTYFVEFTPNGETRLSAGQSVRNVKIGVSQAIGNQSNPFLLRLSGINGAIITLRKENM